MGTALQRVTIAIRRTLAKADTWIAVAGLWLAGVNTARHNWGLVGIFGILGLIFFVSSGDYAWRKGFTKGRHS